MATVLHPCRPHKLQTCVSYVYVPLSLFPFYHCSPLTFALQTPAPLAEASGSAGPFNEKSGIHSDPEAGVANAARITDAEKRAADAVDGPKPKLRISNRVYNAWRRTYCPIEEPALILPSAPTDEEKLNYLHTNRIPLYIFGLISFLSLSAGMWLFALCSIIFVWYAVFVGFVDIYLIISYFVGIIGKDWDYKAHQEAVANNPVTPENAPTVDVYLPVCAEPLEILSNTWNHVQRLDWPADKIQVHVLDDGAMDTVRDLAQQYGFNYIVREDRPRLKKAGNLRWAFARTSGDFFTIFDADFCPRSDFLRELVAVHLDDDKTAIVQSPQFFRVRDDQTWVEQGAGATQELFYRVVQVNRNRWGASICVGSNAMYRRAALEEVGGTAEIGFSEDVHTG